MLSQAAAAGLDWSDYDGDDDADFAEDESSYFIWCDALADADVAHTAQCGFAASSSSSDAIQAPVAEDLTEGRAAGARTMGGETYTHTCVGRRTLGTSDGLDTWQGWRTTGLVTGAYEASSSLAK